MANEFDIIAKSELDITSTEPLFNLNPEKVVYLKTSSPDKQAGPNQDLANNPWGDSSGREVFGVDLSSDAAAAADQSATQGGWNWPHQESPLELLYNITDRTGAKNFNKVAGFLGNIAEAESFKGKIPYNTSSSASGAFHFFVGNGGGYTKDGKRTRLGQYDKNGVLRTSSFETAKKRLRVLVGDKAIADKVNAAPALMSEVGLILKAKTPDELSHQQQAMLAYANLKLTSQVFDKFLHNKAKAADVYAQSWVTLSGSHSLKEIHNNWKNAERRGGGLPAALNFLGIKRVGVDYASLIPSYSDGGKITSRLDAKRILIPIHTQV